MMMMKACAIAFLATQSVAGFSVNTAPSVARQSALSMTAEANEEKEDVKVGVIGCGRIGLVHLEAITKAPGVVPVIISNPTVSKAEKGT